MKDTHRKIFSFAYAFNYISQAAFCMICPAAIIVLIGIYIQKKTGAGDWLVAASIVIGVLVGFYCMISYLVKSSFALELAEKKDKEKSKSSGYKQTGDVSNKNSGGVFDENK